MGKFKLQIRHTPYDVWEDVETFTDRDEAMKEFEMVVEERNKLNIASNINLYRLREGDFIVHYYD